MTVKLSACACMGPQGNDLLCPCAMRRAGLTPSNAWTTEKKQDLYSILEKLKREDNVNSIFKK